MKFKALFGAMVAAGVIGGVTGYGVAQGPFASAHATAPVVAAGVAAPAANPGATTLPLNGFSDLVKKYGAAVVNVSVEGTRRVASRGGGAMPEIPEELREYFRGFGGRIPMPRGDVPMRGQGSGFIVSSDGYILTNAHVVENAEVVNVRLTDRREYRAKVVGADKATDIAVLKVDAKESLPSVKLGSSSNASVGEWLVAIGSPFGFENSVSAGILSAKGRSLPDATYTQFIQTDVAVNPGNSGGPLFNLAGEVIGINSQIYSRTGGFQGISFAIPIETALKVKDDLIKHGKVTRGRIGVTVQEVNAQLAESFGLDRPRGALVSQVDADGPGAKAGLQAGDIITKYDGKPVERSADLPVLVGDTPSGKRAALEVWRKRGYTTLAVAPTNTPRESDRVAEGDDDAVPKGRLGLAVRPLAPEEGGRGAKGGLVVEQVTGPAARAGIQPGDVVLSFNGAAVKSAEELRDLVGKAGRNAALLIQRDNRQLFVPVELG